PKFGPIETFPQGVEGVLAVGAAQDGHGWLRTVSARLTDCSFPGHGVVISSADTPASDRDHPLPGCLSLATLPARSVAVHDLLPGDAAHPRRGLFVAVGRAGSPAADALPRQVLPVEPEDLLEVRGDLLVLEDQAGVAVHQRALVRPVVTADQHAGAVHDD